HERRTVKDAIWDLRKMALGSAPDHFCVENSYLRLIRRMHAEGVQSPYDLRVVRGLEYKQARPLLKPLCDKCAPGFMMWGAAWDQPCRTITGGPHTVHPSEDRLLSVREHA